MSRTGPNASIAASGTIACSLNALPELDWHKRQWQQ
jgi:hypothetical protein